MNIKIPINGWYILTFDIDTHLRTHQLHKF